MHALKRYASSCFLMSSTFRVSPSSCFEISVSCLSMRFVGLSVSGRPKGIANVIDEAMPKSSRMKIEFHKSNC